VFNLCVNHTQFMNRRKAWSLDSAREDDEGSGYEPTDERIGTPLEDMQLSERARILREVVDELPDNQRRALMLSRFEALSHEEIGRVMELSVQAVKSLLWRARENLRKALRPLLDEDDTR
jgi:RNA polymerase sigma-70 factor (ECF subfamily)